MRPSHTVLSSTLVLISRESGKKELFRITDDPHDAKKVDKAARTDALPASIDATQSALVIPVIDPTRTLSPEAGNQLREPDHVG